jgi:cobalt-zinc-cadmium efflux system outer membrane protein
MSFFTCLRVGLCACLIANTSIAWAISTLPTALPGQPPSSHRGAEALGLYLNRILDESPEIQAAQATVDAERARLQGAGMPLYNPELELEAERVSGISNFGVGLSQTIDLYGKRTLLEQAARANLAAVQARLDALRQQKAIELLDALIRILNSKEITSLAKQRFQLLDRFQTLAEQRQSAGDIPSVEVELARLAATEAAMAHAHAGADLVEAKGDFNALAGQLPVEQINMPATLPIQLPGKQEDEQHARNHPDVRQAQLLVQAARMQINAVDRERKADPTLGLMGGRDDEENKITLSLSIPLYVNNDFSSNTRVARAKALQAEQEAHQAYRATLAKLQTARERYRLIAQAWRVWISRGQTSLEQQSKSLEKLWRAGELETTEYLVQLQQILNTRIAGAELQGDLWSAWIDWQGATGQIFRWTSSLNSEMKQ